MSKYHTSKLVIANLVQAERSDRYQSHKLARRSNGVHGATLCRELYFAGVSINDLADRFGVTPQAIGQCVNFKTYRNV